MLEKPCVGLLQTNLLRMDAFGQAHIIARLPIFRPPWRLYFRTVL